MTVRRLHDIDRSGWWILIALVPLIGTIVLLVFALWRAPQAPTDTASTRRRPQQGWFEARSQPYSPEG